MFVIAFAAAMFATQVAAAVRRAAPSNIVIRRVLTRSGYRWALPVGLAGIVAYGAVAFLAGSLATHEGGGAWYLVFIVALYNTVRFAVLIPVATLRLLAARWRDRRAIGSAATEGRIAVIS